MMATVKMRHKISGNRDGRPWPDPGGTIEVPADEADRLVRQRMATLATDIDQGDEGDGQDQGGDGIDDMTVVQLRESLKSAELSTSGNKAELVERLRDAD